MANYVSKYTGAQVDEAVGKALNPSYNDLTDKPFYEEPAVIGKVFECTIPAGQNNLYFDAPEGFSFVEGIPVTINGTTLEADDVYANEGVHFKCGEYLTIEGTHYLNNIIFGQMCVTAYDPNGQGDTVDRHVSIDVAVVVKEPVTHTIEPKFLPGVCLPVIEVENTSVTELTDAQNEVLMAAAEALTPIILRIKNLNGGACHVLELCQSDDTGDIIYYADLNTMRYSGHVYLMSRYADGQRGGFTMTWSAGA